jgi:hypothetical protein
VFYFHLFFYEGIFVKANNILLKAMLMTSEVLLTLAIFVELQTMRNYCVQGLEHLFYYALIN